MAIRDHIQVGGSADSDRATVEQVLGTPYRFAPAVEGGVRKTVEGNLVLSMPEQGFYRPGTSYYRTKRALDILLTSLVLLFLFPFFLLIALLIALDSRGPVLFRQIRVGKDGREFSFYKFRSMVPDAEERKRQLADRNEADGPIFKIKDDPRVTRIGRVLRKYSLDELPQLINVLRGDMSLVGPRPHLPAEVARYDERQRQRLLVPPGLVCLREVSGRSRLSFDRWVEMDLLYIEYRCFATDMRILLRVLPAVIRGDGAY